MLLLFKFAILCPKRSQIINLGILQPASIEAIKLELGDVLWYVAQLSTELGLELEEVATTNLNKLLSRASRDKISGDGDFR